MYTGIFLKLMILKIVLVETAPAIYKDLSQRSKVNTLYLYPLSSAAL